jgi:alpha-L-fucosidase
MRHLALLVCLLGSASAAEPVAAAPSRTAWFEEARFGMFIHFGLYSIPAGEWDGKRMGRNDYAEWIRMQHNWPNTPVGIPRADYDKLLAQFNPARFDADAWADAIHRAGMRYLVITAKHHDGFALWKSKVSRYNVVDATPFGRDLLAELAAACRKRDIRFGVYYSHWLDWDHPGGAQPPWPEIKPDPVMVQPSQEAYQKYWDEKCLPQVAEICDHLKPDFIWFDSWGGKSRGFLTDARLDRLIALVRERAPGCLINSRIGRREGVDLLSMGDNQFPSQGFDLPWETSGTLNHSWGYNRFDHKWKPVTQLVRHLVDNASLGGNYQLNVGPMGDGAFQKEASESLSAIGRWMDVNAESIRGTMPSKLAKPAWGRYTFRAPGTLYLHVYEWPKDRRLIVTGFKGLPRESILLDGKVQVAASYEPGTGLIITLPEARPDTPVPVIRLTGMDGLGVR